MILVPYTDEEVDLIADLLKDGLSASKIAGEVGRSKSAIIGKVDRHPRLRAIGFANRSCSGRVRGKPKPVAKTASPKPEAAQPAPKATIITTPQAFKPGCLPPARPIPAPSLNLALADLDARQCRYATNDAAIGEEHLFCGQPTEDGSSYCACHRAMCFN